MVQTVTLASIRRGYPYQVDFVFPEGFLADGETFRAELRQTPTQTVAVAEFAVERDGDTVTLSLDETADIPLRQHLMDLTLVLGDGSEEPLRSPRYIVPVEEHVTRADA
jgi:hypothetical protein